MSNRDSAVIGTPPSTASVDDLVLVRERTRRPVNEFLDRHHPEGQVPGWLAAFSARYRDIIVAVVIIGRPINHHADDGTEASIIRFARRDDRPDNTGSWLIARARRWCRLEGYERLTAHAGVSGNYGTVYEAAGFDCQKVETAEAGSWSRRGDDRKTNPEYERRKWVSYL